MVAGAHFPTTPIPLDRHRGGSALRRLLAAIENGEIDADDPRAQALQRRLEGAMAPWGEAGGMPEELS
jgi:ABC-type phosphate transport system auxiliary subunit